MDREKLEVLVDSSRNNLRTYSSGGRGAMTKSVMFWLTIILAVALSKPALLVVAVAILVFA